MLKKISFLFVSGENRLVNIEHGCGRCGCGNSEGKIRECESPVMSFFRVFMGQMVALDNTIVTIIPLI